jgi:hypothetical protein
MFLLKKYYFLLADVPALLRLLWLLAIFLKLLWMLPVFCCGWITVRCIQTRFYGNIESLNFLKGHPLSRRMTSEA